MDCLHHAAGDTSIATPLKYKHLLLKCLIMTPLNHNTLFLIYDSGAERQKTCLSS